MSWIQKCCETYDNNTHMVGRRTEGNAQLAPVFFITANAHIELTLTEDGEFVSASAIPQSECKTLIPATEKSAQRSSNSVFPHPLCDQLAYVASGYESYLSKAVLEKSKHDYKKMHQSFIRQLEKWSSSEHSCFIVDAVLEYCRRGELMSDLITSGLVNLDESGYLPVNKKGHVSVRISGTDCEKCLVRWRVQRLGETGECWLSSELFDKYAAYCLTMQNEGALTTCYVTGEQAVPAVGFPKGIVSASYGAKLISANDTFGFTYRGRFNDPLEAFTVGSVVVKKAHNALSWVIANQGVYYGATKETKENDKNSIRTFVCWNPRGKPVPSFDENMLAFEEDELDYSLTNPEYKQKLKNAIAGAREKLDGNDDVVIMGLEAATTGRLSITYYGELSSSDYLKRLENWQETCCWFKRFKTKSGENQTVIASPSIKEIIRCAFGTEKKQKDQKFIEADGALMKEHSQRLLHCIVDGSPLPFDIVNAVKSKASARAAYDHKNYEQLLFTACALIRKFRNDISSINNNGKGEKWTMELDKASKDRSYLFGRLLAIAEKVERSTYERDEKREPAAIRLQAAFAAHPFRTWATIEKMLAPYYAKLKPGSRRYYRDCVGGIIASMPETDSIKLNLPLEDTYLLGYYLQRRELNSGKQNNAENEATDCSNDE